MDRQDARWALGAAGLVLLLRLPFLGGLALPDEGGYLMVARQWRLDDPTLYGGYWVDRPPVLLLLYKVAGDTLGLRLLGVLMCLVLVAAATAAGRSLAGARGGRWAGFTAAALGSAYSLGALEVDAALLAAPFVMLCVAAVLRAVASGRSRRSSIAFGVAAGVVGAAAVLVKQSFVDGLVFAAVLALVSATRPELRRRALGVLGAGTAGVLLVAGAVAAWAWSVGPGVLAVYDAMYGFRLQAVETILAGGTDPPRRRLLILLVVSVVSGLVVVLASGLRRALPALRRADPVGWAFLVMLAAGVLAIAAGGSYWRDYLVQLVPAAVVAVGLVARDGVGRLLVLPVGLVVTSALVGLVVAAVVPTLQRSERSETAAVVDWLREYGEPGQSAVVIYGRPNLVYEARMSSPYRYLWSLPTRVHDPDLRLLRHTVAGPHGPDWVVAWHDPDTWDLDGDRRLAALLDTEYELAATVAGRPIYARASDPVVPATDGRSAMTLGPGAAAHPGGTLGAEARCGAGGERWSRSPGWCSDSRRSERR